MAMSLPQARPAPNRDRLAVVLGIVAAALLFVSLLHDEPAGKPLCVHHAGRLRPRQRRIPGDHLPAPSLYRLHLSGGRRSTPCSSSFPAGSCLSVQPLQLDRSRTTPRITSGFANYSEILHDRQFLDAMWNNIQLFLAIFIIQNIIGLPIALALDTKLRGHEFYRSALFLPVIVSLVATAYIWQIILGPNIGMLNPVAGKTRHTRLGAGLAGRHLSDVQAHLDRTGLAAYRRADRHLPGRAAIGPGRPQGFGPGRWRQRLAGLPRGRPFRCWRRPSPS